MDFSQINYQDVLIQFVVLLLSLSFHESAHAWSAERLGDDTARLLGRVSLNPIVHIDPIGTVMLPLLAMLTGIRFLFGWAKPVPVNLLNLRHPKQDFMWIAAAGPISNLILASGCLAILWIWRILAGPEPFLMFLTGQSHPLYSPLLMLLYFGVVINVVLAFFNLIPIPPLDGSNILYRFLPIGAAEAYDQIRPYGFVLLMAILWLGVTDWYFRPIFQFVGEILPGP